MTRRQVSANHRSFSATEVGLQRPCGACSRAEKLHDWRHMVVMDFIKKLRDKARKQRKKFQFRKDADVAWGNSGRSWDSTPIDSIPKSGFRFKVSRISLIFIADALSWGSLRLKGGG